MKKLFLAFLLFPFALFGANTNLFNNVWMTSSLRLTFGAPGVGQVLTSDANGFGTWQAPSGGGGNAFTNASQTWQISSGANTWTNNAQGRWQFIEGINFVSIGSNADPFGTTAQKFRIYNDSANVLYLGEYVSMTGYAPRVDSASIFSASNAVLHGNLTTGTSAANIITINQGTGATPNGVNWNNGQINWDANGRVGMGGSTTPTHTLTFPMSTSTNNGIAMYNTSDQTNVFEVARLFWTNNIFHVSTYPNAIGSGLPRTLRLESDQTQALTSGARIDIIRGQSPSIREYVSGLTSVLGTFLQIDRTSTSTNSTVTLVDIIPTYNQGGTAGFTGLSVNSITNTTGTGTKLIVNFQGNSNSVFKIDNDYRITLGTNGSSFIASLSTNFTTDPPSIPAQASFMTNFVFTGAKAGMPCILGSTVTTSNVARRVDITADNVATVQWINAGASAADPANQDLRFRVINE